jgi:flagellin
MKDHEMSDISLSAGVRQALFSLQTTTALGEAQQIKLATGRKVNSALDNPASFFTAASLNSRASDFSRLLDDMGQAVKTVEAADNGIKALTKLVETAQGIARQARGSTDAATRTSLAGQFDDLRTQIDNLVKDTGYNGINLLNDAAASNKLTVVFNEKTGTSQTSIDIEGILLDTSAAGLNVGAAGAAWTADAAGNTAIDAQLTALTNAIGKLRTESGKFGANLTVVKARQEFSRSLINTLSTGADNLVLADSNEEGAKLVTLQTRQQLSSTALSLANQSDQSVLRLFG